MRVSPWFIVATVLAVVFASWDGHRTGVRDENVRWEAKTYHELAESSEAARKQEAMWQGVINGAVRNYENEVAGVRRNLGLALDGLRSRPDRAPGGMPADARAACAGGTGAELSRADAEFLVGEAARADEQRAGLAACYRVIDGVRR